MRSAVLRTELTRTLAIVAVVMSVASCGIPPFEPSASPDANLRDLPRVDQEAFCREAASYLTAHVTRDEFESARCFYEALTGGSFGAPWYTPVDDVASCEAYVERCRSMNPSWRFVDDCSHYDVTVRAEVACIEHQVMTEWPILSAELRCDMFGTPAFDEVWARARPQGLVCQYAL